MVAFNETTVADKTSVIRKNGGPSMRFSNQGLNCWTVNIAAQSFAFFYSEKHSATLLNRIKQAIRQLSILKHKLHLRTQNTFYFYSESKD